MFCDVYLLDMFEECVVVDFVLMLLVECMWFCLFEEMVG